MENSVAQIRGGELEYKILVLGCSQVGKTSLIRRYTTGHCPSGMMATVGIDYKSKTLQVEGVAVELKIWDTAGQERFFTFTKQFFRGSHGIMLVYDITSQSSFIDIKRWINAVEEAGLGEESMVLIGNKYDLEKIREVESSSGQQLAHVHDCSFFETSAKTGHNIEQVFYEVAHGIMIRHGIFIPGRLPSLGPVVFARSDSASISGSKSIKLLTSTDLEAETQQKKKCCLQSN